MQPFSLHHSLEGDLERELNFARATTAKERGAAAHVGGCREREEVMPDAIGIAIKRGIHHEIREHRVGEVGMVEDVEEISCKPRLHALGNVDAARDGEIEVLIGRSAERITTEVTDVLATGASVLAHSIPNAR